VVRVRPAGELVVGGREETGGGWSLAGLSVAEYKQVDGGGAEPATGTLIGKWFFMNDLTREGGRPWESADLGV
jgi:hypothetical protein